jgi:Domain of unknown function (DUF4422)
VSLWHSLVRALGPGRRADLPCARVVVSHYGSASYWRPSSSLFLHVQAGRALSSVEPGTVGDDTGAHISEKNPSFGELTAMYWAWKNLTDLDIIGFCHYRRYFLLDPRFQENVFLAESELDALEPALTDTTLLRQIGNSDVLVTKPRDFGAATIESQYKALHRPHHFDVMVQAVVERYPQYARSRDAFTGSRQLYCCNMFIARRAFFHRYMQWAFTVLADLEARITADTGGYQRRTFAFLAERLLNWHLIHMKMTGDLRIRELGVAFLDEASYRRTFVRY